MRSWAYLAENSEFDDKTVAFAADLKVNPLTALILQQRGIQTIDAARAFLDPDHYRPSLPDVLPDLEIAARRLRQAIQQNQRVLIWGDMDVDGQASAAILHEAFSKQNAEVQVHIADSHGLNRSVLRQLCSSFKPQVVIACDTGINAHGAADDLLNAGIDFIIADHHDLPDEFPNALAIINPKRLAESHPLRTLPSSAIAYLLVQQLYELLGQELLTHQLLDLVALSIVADAAQLVGDARYLLQHGLERLRKTTRPGLLALAEISRVDLEHLAAEDIAYQLAPRLNAFARLDNPRKGFELLTTHQKEAAAMLAAQSETLNQKRRLLSRQILQSAHEQIASDRSLLDWSVLVLENPNWEPGVISAVAGQLAELYARPVVLLVSDENGVARGTARSFGGYDIHTALKTVDDLLSSYGGHAEAAGLSLDVENLPMLRRRLSNAINTQKAEPPTLSISAVLQFDQLNLETAGDLEQLAPFGSGYPRPIFVVKNVRKFRSAKHGINEQHRRLTLRDSDGRTQQVYWWNSADLPMPEGIIDLAFEMSLVFQNGQYDVQLTLVDWQQVEVPEVVAPKPELIDCRAHLDLAAIRQQEPSLVIWAEGFSQSESPGVSYSDLFPAEALVIYTPPCNPEILAEVIERVQPRRIYVHAAPTPFEQPTQLLPAILALLKTGYSRHSKRTVSQLAERTAQPESTVRLALQSLSDYIRLDWFSNNAFRVESIATPDKIEVPPALAKAMQETAAYRRYFQKADLENLFP